MATRPQEAWPCASVDPIACRRFQQNSDPFATVFSPQIQHSCHTAPLLAARAFGVLAGEDSLVRELRELNRDMVRSSDRRPKDTGLSLGEIARQSVAEAERHAIRLALQATHGNKSEAARLLRVDYKTLHLKVKRYGIDTREFRVS